MGTAEGLTSGWHSCEQWQKKRAANGSTKSKQPKSMRKGYSRGKLSDTRQNRGPETFMETLKS
jgi:hypothetical protein